MGLRIRVDKQSLFQFCWTGTWITILFTVIYGYTNWRAEFVTERYQFYFPWELQIPLVPWMILPYLSLNLLTSMPLFLLNPGELRLLGRRLALATLIAGMIFFLFPAPIGFTRPASVPGWDFLFQILWSLDKSSNTLPSLHITYSALTVLSFWNKVKSNLRFIFLIWFLMITLAVLLTWQHHVLDIVTGVALALFCQLLLKDSVSDTKFSWKL